MTLDHEAAQLLSDGISTEPKTNSMTMVERVARAIDAKGCKWAEIEHSYDDYGDDEKEFLFELARAAIDTMRDLYKTLPGPMGNKEDSDKLNAAIGVALE